MKAIEVTAGLAESNGSLLPGLWRDSLHVTCGLTACTPGSAPGPTLGNEYGKTLPLPFTPVPSYATGPSSSPHRASGQTSGRSPFTDPLIDVSSRSDDDLLVLAQTTGL